MHPIGPKAECTRWLDERATIGCSLRQSTWAWAHHIAVTTVMPPYLTEPHEQTMHDCGGIFGTV
jgi:hypothetical protein